jgi:hypothetical protein
MSLLFTFLQPIYNDAPEPWQIGFQDGASPGFEGITELHDSIFFFLVVISVGVFWALGSVMINFNSTSSPIVYKYANHGTKMCLHAKSNYLIKNKNIGLRYYSSQEVAADKVDSEAQIVNIKPEKCYNDAYALKSLILKENKNKSGIYRFTNKLNGNFYIGSSKDLNKRFIKYFNLSYIATEPATYPR